MQLNKVVLFQIMPTKEATHLCPVWYILQPPTEPSYLFKKIQIMRLQVSAERYNIQITYIGIHKSYRVIVVKIYISRSLPLCGICERSFWPLGCSFKKFYI